MRNLFLSFVLLSAATTLSAQEPFRIHAWLPDGYRNEVLFDLEAMRGSGAWDECDTGMFRVMLRELQSEIGMDFDEIDRITLIAAEAPVDDARRREKQRIVVVEGNRPIEPPDRLMSDPTTVIERIGGYEIHRRKSRYRDDIVFHVRPDVWIEGSFALISPKLAEGAGPGIPCPDVLSLLSGPRDGELFHAVLDLADTRMNAELLDSCLPDTKWPENDRPQFVAFRLRATGDEDDPHLEVSAVLRHPLAGEGVRVSNDAIAARIAEGIANPQLRGVRKLLSAVEQRIDRSDVVLRVDLGRAREATQTLVLALSPLFMVRRVESVQAVPLQQAPQPQPAQPEKKNTGGND